MQSRASLAADGMNSVKPTSVDPNLRFKCLARWDPRAFAASSGTVNKCTPSRVRNQLNQDSRTLGCLSPGYRFKAIRGVQRLSRQCVHEEFRDRAGREPPPLWRSKPLRGWKSGPVLSERRYEVRLSRLPALSIVFTALVAGRRQRRDLAPGAPGRIPQSPTRWTRQYSSSPQAQCLSGMESGFGQQ